jgi:hypothetical protein
MDQLFTQREGVILMQVTQVCHIDIQVTSLYFLYIKDALLLKRLLVQSLYKRSVCFPVSIMHVRSARHMHAMMNWKDLIKKYDLGFVQLASFLPWKPIRPWGTAKQASSCQVGVGSFRGDSYALNSGWRLRGWAVWLWLYSQLYTASSSIWFNAKLDKQASMKGACIYTVYVCH